MDNNLSRNQLNALRQKVREANEAKWLESCKQRLTKIISKKMTTTFIGSLDIFEQHFGFLWKPDANGHQTKEQKAMEKLYQQVRTEVLNHGNNQRRAAENEIANHVVSWNRYHVDLKIKKESQ